MEFDQLHWVIVAKIGRTWGIKGHLFLHLLTDFPNQIQKNLPLYCAQDTLFVESFDPVSLIVKFQHYNSAQDAKKLVNSLLYMTKEETKKHCQLKENEFFWFDLIGASIIEHEELLGIVCEIERIGMIDYLIIQTTKALQEQKLPKSFMIPYTNRYILEVLATNPRQIICQYCKDILESS